MQVGIELAAHPINSARFHPRRLLPNETLFRSLAEARRLIAAWQHDYNHSRPHSKLGWLTPAGPLRRSRQTRYQHQRL